MKVMENVWFLFLLLNIACPVIDIFHICRCYLHGGKYGKLFFFFGVLEYRHHRTSEIMKHLVS